MGPGSGPYTARCALLGAYVEAARAVGLEPMRKLRQAGLPAGALDNPDLEVPADRVVYLLAESARTSGREDFGLVMARAYKVSMLGPIGILARQQATLLQALEVLGRYRTTPNSALRFSLEPRFDSCILRLNMPGAAKPESYTCDFSLGFALRIVQGLLGAHWRPRRTFASRPRPSDPAAHLALFGDIVFDQDIDGLEIPMADLALPLLAADPDMAREIARYLEMTCHNDRSSLAERVEELVRRLLSGGQCSIEEVAAHLGVNRRTIHRQLARAGMTFSQLVDKVRHEIVAARMRSGDVCLGDLAERLGFSSPSTFSRWFRAAYGCCAREFRQAA